MKLPIQNSRRNFLSSMAILTSASLFAGSPLDLLNETAGKKDLKKSWALFLEKYEAGSFINLTGMQLPFVSEPLKGQQHQTTGIVHFEKQGILAQATFIHWNNNKNADDVLISFFESNNGYKKIITINRFELEALITLPATTSEDKNLLTALCNNRLNKPGNKNGLQVKTMIRKTKQVHDIKLYQHNNIIFKDQLFYNI